MYYVRKLTGDKRIMKPRIFVSSTFYDLKYAREDIAGFIKAHDFEPIMFEESDIGYTPGKPLDESCYESMRTADMVILIIGGNYGSPATGEEPDKFKEFISITRREYETAISNGIPVFCFIDSKVYIEHSIYENNDNPDQISFVATKNVNIFKFIKEIKEVGSIPITEFDKTNQIKEFLGKQWSDMFKQYLGILREKKEIARLENTMSDMRNLISSMGLMLDSVGKKVLNGEDDEYEQVLKKQKVMRVANAITDNFNFISPYILDKGEQDPNFYNNIVSAFAEIIDKGKLIKPDQRLDEHESPDERIMDSIFASHSVLLSVYTTPNEKDYKLLLRDFKEVDPGELAEILREIIECEEE